MSMLLRRVTDRLSYANVVATLALFLALGGSSYAVVALSPDSVGPRQLQVGAVTPRALGFPLDVRGTTDNAPTDLQKNGCNSPRPPGAPPIGYECPLPLRLRSPLGCPYRGCKPRRRTPGEVALNVRAPGQLVVSVVVGLRDDGPVGTTANVRLGLIVDRRLVSEANVTMSGGQAQQVPMQFLTNVSPGQHVAETAASANYSYYQPGDVIVAPVSLIVSALPRA